MKLENATSTGMKLTTIVLFTSLVSGCVSSSLDDAGFDSASLVNDQITTPSSEPVDLSADLTQLRTSNQSNETSALRNQPDTDQETVSLGFASANEQPTNAANNASSEQRLAPISPAQRQTGVNELRQKITRLGTTKTDINAPRTPATSHMSRQEQQLIRAELQAEALAASGAISDEELLIRKRKIAAMRIQAKSHYNSALRKIQK